MVVAGSTQRKTPGIGRKPAIVKGWPPLMLTTGSQSKTTDLKNEAIRVGKGMTMFAPDLHLLRHTGHQGMTLSAIQAPMAITILLFLITRKMWPRALNRVPIKTGAADWQPNFSIHTDHHADQNTSLCCEAVLKKYEKIRRWPNQSINAGLSLSPT